MGFLIFISVFLLLLILLIIVGSLQQLSLYTIMRRKLEFVIMIIPALLTILSFSLIIIGLELILNIFDMSSINLLYAYIMNWDLNITNIMILSLSYILAFVSFILLQALSLKLVYIDYINIYKNIKRFIRVKILRKEEIKQITGEVTETISVDLVKYNNTNKIPFITAISCSLFTFAIAFFIILLLLSIGIIMAKTQLAHII